VASYWTRDRRQLFYVLLALLGMAAVLIGFSTTYILPLSRRSFHAPTIVHVHGALALSWIGLFAAQSLLIRQGAPKLHMRLGLVALPIALGVLFSGIAVARWTVRRDFPALGDLALSSLTGTFTSLSIFTALVVGAMLLRRRPDWHKRLLLLATIVVWWPAWFRWRHLFPPISRPELVFGVLLPDLPMLIAALRDWTRFGAVHPVWKFVAPAVFAEQLFECFVFNTAPWAEAGRWLYAISG
jgi:hypothetical protein